jgi:hypothetical protein
MLRRASPKRDTSSCLRLAASFFVAAACTAISVSSAEAACGDYVAIGSERAGHFAGQTQTVDGRLLAASSPGSQAGVLSDHSKPQPCHGPNCNRRAPHSPQPAPASSGVTVDQWAFWSATAAESQSAFSRCPSVSDVLLASGFHRIPEHPPKR